MTDTHIYLFSVITTFCFSLFLGILVFLEHQLLLILAGLCAAPCRPKTIALQLMTEDGVSGLHLNADLSAFSSNPAGGYFSDPTVAKMKQSRKLIKLHLVELNTGKKNNVSQNDKNTVKQQKERQQ